jgi:hypothetical protein
VTQQQLINKREEGPEGDLIDPFHYEITSINNYTTAGERTLIATLSAINEVLGLAEFSTTQ